MRHSQGGAEFQQEFDQPGIVCQNAHRPTFDLVPYAPVEVFDRVRDGLKLAHTLTEVKEPQEFNYQGSTGYLRSAQGRPTY